MRSSNPFRPRPSSAVPFAPLKTMDGNPGIPPKRGCRTWVLLLLGHLLGADLSRPVSGEDWPQWRGADRSNVSAETGLMRAWPTNGPPLRWTVRGLGEGIAAVAVADGRAYTLGYRDKHEFLYAVDATTGEQAWVTATGLRRDSANTGINSLMRWLSPRVPTVDRDRVYAISAAGVLSCLRTIDGTLLWRRDYRTDFLSPPRIWGFCDYPLVDGDNLILTPMGPDSAVVAVNKHTGVIVWKCPLPGPDSAGHAALVVSEAAGIRHYVTLLGQSLIGVAANDGHLLWRYLRPKLRIASSYTPLVLGDRIITPNGYGGGMNLIRILRDGAGLRIVEEYHEKLSFNPFQDSTTLVGGRLHAIEGAGTLVCLDPLTGKAHHTLEELPSNRRTAITYADGHLYLRRSDGTMCLVEDAPGRYRLKGTFSIPEPEEVTGVTFPVVANGLLYLRDNDRLLCYDLRVGAQAPTPAIEHTLLPSYTDAIIADAQPPESPARTGVNRAPDAIFVPTPGDIVARMLELARLAPTHVIYDLGSGDGRFLIAAARKYGCRGIGLEIDPRLVAMARESVRIEGLEHLIRIEHADMFEADFSEADAVTAYLPSPMLERLLPQLRKLRSGARVVTHQFPIPGLNPVATEQVVSKEDGDSHRIQVWMPSTIPAAP